MTAVARAIHAGEPGTGDVTHAALTRLLDDLASVLVHVSRSAYIARPLPGVSGSIGEHVRHILDHIAAFAATPPHGVVSYDRRERGTAVESDSGVALRAILRLKALLAVADHRRLDLPVTVSSVLVHGQPPVSAWSTLRRELAFVVSHTVHHQALIAVLLSLAGDDVPADFGLAPSTPRAARS
jgi:uncharacterized damage-inducible protein DinB